MKKRPYALAMLLVLGPTISPAQIRTVPGQRPKPTNTTTTLQKPQLAAVLKPAEYPDITLLAGSEGNTVFLKWVVTTGWIPSGKGFQVYRELNGVRQGPLNPSPITSQAPDAVQPAMHKRFIVSPIKARLTPTYALSVADLIATAKTTVPGKSDRLVFSLKPSNLPRKTSTDVFNAVKAQIQSVARQRPAMVPPSNYINTGIALPAVSERLSLFRKSTQAVASKRLLMLQSSSVENKVRDARMALHVGILARAEVAAAAGSAFEDTQSASGSTYTYVLTFQNDAGAEVEMARKTITVGQDLQPTPPKTVRAVQTGPNEVALDWDAGDETQLASLGLDTYNIYRIDSTHPQGQLITANPVAKSVQQSTDGTSLVENWFTMLDRSAPVGNVTYQVRMVDGLGRESATSTNATYTVEDWATPAAPTSVTVGVGFNRVINGGALNRESLLIQAPYDPDASYHVYRIDTELKSAQPVLVKDLLASEGSRTSGNGAAQGKDAVESRFFRPYDQNLPEDHHFRYLVTAFYARNKYESTPTISPVVGIPTLVAPSPPTGLAGPVAYASLTAGSTVAVITPPRMKFLPPQRLIGYSSPNYGATVNLTWTEPTTLGAPFTYRVYRLNVTPPPPAPVRRIVPMRALGRLPRLQSLSQPAAQSSNASPSQPKSQLPSRTVSPQIGTQVKPKAGLQATLRTQLVAHQRMVQSPSMATVIGARFGDTASTTVMTAQVDTNMCADGIVPSQSAQDYEYYVVPINRWGFEGKPSASFTVHIKPTIAPAAPHLALVSDNPDNRVQILVNVATSPDEQEVTSYRVFRADLGYHFYGTSMSRPVIPTGPKGPKNGPKLPPQIQTKPATKFKPGAPINIDNDQSGANVPTNPTTITYTPPSPEVEANYVEVTANKITTVTTQNGLVYMVDTSCEPVKDYAYKVVAVNSIGLNSARSSYLVATSLPTSCLPPTMYSPVSDATGITMTYQGNPETLVYKSPDGRVVTTATLFKGRVILERTLAGSTNWLPIPFKTDAVGYMGIKDESPIQGQTYKYRLREIDIFGNISPPCAELTVAYNPQ